MKHCLSYNDGIHDISLTYDVKEISPTEFEIMAHRQASRGTYESRSRRSIKAGISSMSEAEAYSKEQFDIDMLKIIFRIAKEKHPDLVSINTKFENNHWFAIVETSKFRYTYDAMNMEELRIELKLVEEKELS